MRRSVARMLLLLLLLEVSLPLRELLRLSGSDWTCAGSKLGLLKSQLLLMLLHQLELTGQVLQHVLLLGGEVLSLLQAVKHLQLLRGEIEHRPLLWRRRLLSRLESLGWYCIVVALGWIGRRCSRVSWLKIGIEKKN